MKKINGFAIVTGASRGLGAAMALRCAKDGHNVVINYTSESSRVKAEEVAAQIREMGRKALVVKCDVSNYAECAAMVKSASEEFGERMAILVANAGIKNLLNFEDLTAEDYERVIRVNLLGVMNMVHVSIPYMKEGNEGGSIVMISSVAGQMGAAKRADYATTKSGMYGFMKSLALELGEYNIRVNTIAPGMIMTDMLRNNDPAILAKNLEVQPLKFIAEPEEIADAMSYLNTACYVDGQILAVNGGWYR